MVLATDGRTSFAILTYEDPSRIVNITTDQSGIGAIGFDAGDLRRSTTILSRERTKFPLQQVNVFRIDGNPLAKVRAMHSKQQFVG